MGTAGDRNIQISVNRRLSSLKHFFSLNTKEKTMTQNLYQKIHIKQVLVSDDGAFNCLTQDKADTVYDLKIWRECYKI